MPKRNIYFPADIDEAMDRHKDEKWSVVCQEAVSARIRYLDLKNDEAATAVERARARLAPDRLNYAKDAKDRGLRAGLLWAADHATFDQLRRLYEAVTGTDPKIYLSMLEDVPDIGLTVAYLITAEEWDDPSEVHDERTSPAYYALCNQIGLYPDGTDASSSEFWEGFIQSAIDVYSKV